MIAEVVSLVGSGLVPRRRAVWLVAALLLAGCDRSGSDPVVTLRGTTMGTSYTIRLSNSSDAVSPPDAESLKRQVDALLDRIEDSMSTWRADSELSRFNRFRSDEWFAVSAELVAVVREAQRIAQETNGAFDVTVGPLVDLWHFGPDRGPPQPPSDDAIEAVRRRVGWQALKWREDPPALRKQKPELEVDLSAIAKGYAVDRVAQLLEEAGIEAFLVEIGGEVRTRGRRPDGTPWRVGIERPDPSRRQVQLVLPLENRAMATSGNYRNFFEYQGRKFGHTIDPRTGRPVEHALASVTVLASQCMTADAWATALMVLGPQEGYNLAEERGLAVLMLVREEDGSFSSRTTSSFPRPTAQGNTSASPVETFAHPGQVAPGLTAPEEASAPEVHAGMSTWTTTLLLAAAAFLIAVGGMAVGVLFGRRCLRGSCGGLAGRKDEYGNVLCEMCSSPSPECRGQPVPDDAADEPMPPSPLSPGA